MSVISEVNEELKPWVEHNFPDSPAWMPLLGAGEEIGELYHSFLKRAQGIRLEENHDAKIRDAIGDIVIYLLHFCMLEGIDFEGEVAGAWNNVVKKRNWRPDVRGTFAPV